MPSLSVLVVTYNNAGVVERTLEALREQLAAGDEVIVVDNASPDGAVEGAIVLPENRGFSAAVNAGAAAAGGDLLVLLNPDAVPQDGFTQALRAGAGRGWAAWMGLVTMEGGTRVNTSGGVVHFTGISWAGRVGDPVGAMEPGEVAFASGACLAVGREDFLAAGGLPEEFFLYVEDVDLSMRLRLGGGRIGIEPAARVDHDYEFSKGAHKWRLLERNRHALLLRTYPAALLILLAPALLATELALLVVAAAGGWLPQKLQAWEDTARGLPRLLRERRVVQGRRQISALDFARHLTPDLDSPYLGRAGASRPLRAALRAYWRAVLATLSSSSA